MERIKVERAEFADGSIQKTFSVICSGCGKNVFINTMTRNPAERDYFCVDCGTFVEQDIIDEIIKLMTTD